MVIFLCGWYLIGGIGGYVGYVMPRSSWIGRLYHPFITADDEVDLKEADTCARASEDTCSVTSSCSVTSACSVVTQSSANDSVIQIEGNNSV